MLFNKLAPPSGSLVMSTSPSHSLSPKKGSGSGGALTAQGQWWESSRHGCHGHTDKGRVEKGIERELYFTEPPHQFHIFLLYPATLGNGGRSSRHGCHGHTDKGRVERGIERELYFTEPPVPYISPISSPCRLNSAV